MKKPPVVGLYKSDGLEFAALGLVLANKRRNATL
jgi:hypothetical protein